MNKRKQQSPIAEKFPISEKLNEILKKWKDYPLNDDSIAPWPLCRDFNEENQSDKSETTKSIKEVGAITQSYETFLKN